MNLNKYINIVLIKLSDKYDISVIEIIKAKDKKIYKNYTVNIKTKDNEDKISDVTTYYEKLSKQLISLDSPLVNSVLKNL